MLSLTKFLQTTKVFLSPSIAAFQSANFQSKTLEEKLGFPPKPKKPLTPYFRFLAKARVQIAQSNPQLKAMQVVQECAKQWADVDENTKSKLTEEFMKEKEEYVTLRAVYDSKLTDEQKYEIEAAKQDIVEDKERRAYKKRLREAKKPKKPASGFLRYLCECYNKNDRGGLKNQDYLKKIAKDWNAFPEEKRNVYNEAAKAELGKYKQELAKWELKMIRLGNTDLVRQDALVEDRTDFERKPTHGRGQVKATNSD